MPDGSDSDWPQRFLVVYDRLPGGTGYLHRLASAEGFKEVLLRARDVIESCPCQEKGQDGCHRCLLRRVPATDYDKVSRSEVRQMLDDLLGADGERWHTSPVATTRHIPLERQAESDLEIMFVDTLRDWARLPESRASADAYTTSAGTYSLELRLTGNDGSTLSWRVSQQRTLDGTRPDVLFERLDAPGPRLAVYLDGYEFHAGPRHNRLADDAVKRARLRADGLRVFQLTYFDVKDWRRRVTDNGHVGSEPETPVWRPYGSDGDGEGKARKYYANVRGSLPGELSEAVWVNPADLLLAYLRSPDAARWQWRAEAAVAGLTGITGAHAAALAVDEVGPQVRAALGGGTPEGPRGPVQVITAPDSSGLRLVLAADGRRRPPVWSALAVLDDGEGVHDDETSHKRRWRSWLFWTNVLQFLEHGGGDSVQLTTSLLDGFSHEALAVNGGEGWLASTRRTPAERPGRPADVPGTLRPTVPVPATPHAVAGPAAAATVPTPVCEPDAHWNQVLEYLDPDEAGLSELARLLAEAGTPAPRDGYELDSNGWQAELAWPERRIGIVLAPRTADGAQDYEAQDRDKAFRAAGWEVRPAVQWTAQELAERLNPLDTGPTPQHRRNGTTTDGESER